MGVIFDLDQTLIDSSKAEQPRKVRDWQYVYKLIPWFKLYDGIDSALRYINSKNIRIVIVTSSPSFYCQKIIRHFGIDVNGLICYHDTNRRKPFPDPINKAKNIIGSNRDILSFGDDPNDIKASKKANVISVACLWGCNDINLLIKENPDHAIEQPFSIVELIDKYF
ncbi:MAG: HAD family hydrolase [Clostridia bacterium]|nr:HAD family hydrolase [Clostridia bacterium]